MRIDFSPEDLRFREEVRTFLRDDLPEDLRHAARNTPGVFMQAEVYRRWHGILHARGWLAYQWPERFGGPGWSPVQRYIFERECAIAGAPEIAAQGVRLLAPVLCHFASPEQQAFYLPRILTGEHVWCQGYSEPEAGSDLAALRTRAVRDGDLYVVDGTKIWTTNAHFSNWIFCLVRTDPTVKPQAGISFLLIDMASPGITVTPIPLMSGDHELNQVFFDGVKVPVANRVGEEGQGWTTAKFLLEHERGGSCLAPKLRAHLAQLRRRAATASSSVYRCMAEDAVFMSRLTMLELEAEAMEMLELRLLAEVAAGRTPGMQSSLVALLMSRIRKEIDRLNIELIGADAIQLERRRPLYDSGLPAPIGSEEARLAMPAYLNDLAWSIMAGTDEVMRTIIAKSALGL